MADQTIYKLKSDATVAKALRPIGEPRADGSQAYETQGVLYTQDDYIVSSEIHPDTLARIQDGEMDHLFEEVSADEYEAAMEAIEAARFGTFVPEHEVEAEALLDAGHNVVPRAEKLKLRSSGADAAKRGQDVQKADNADARPGLSLDHSGVPPLGQGEDAGSNPVNKFRTSQYVSAEDAGEIQTDPSGIVASMPEDAEPVEEKPAPRRAAPSRKSSGKSGDDK